MVQEYRPRLEREGEGRYSAITGRVSAPSWEHHRNPCDIKISSPNCFWDMDRDGMQMPIKEATVLSGRGWDWGWWASSSGLDQVTSHTLFSVTIATEEDLLPTLKHFWPFRHLLGGPSCRTQALLHCFLDCLMHLLCQHLSQIQQVLLFPTQRPWGVPPQGFVKQV